LIVARRCSRSEAAAIVLAVVLDGCSLVDDAGVARDDGMPAQAMALLPAGLDMRNLGVGGQTTQMMAADAAAEVDPLYAAARPANNLVCWEGTNDLILGSAPPCDARQAYLRLGLSAPDAPSLWTGGAGEAAEPLPRRPGPQQGQPAGDRGEARAASRAGAAERAPTAPRRAPYCTFTCACIAARSLWIWHS